MIVDANAQTEPFKIIPDGKARRSVEAALAEALVRLEPLAHGPILLTGGDTLMRCLKRLDCREIKPILELYPGVVLSSAFIINRERLIISKSGGFGEETLLTDLQSLIMNYETEE